MSRHDNAPRNDIDNLKLQIEELKRDLHSRRELADTQQESLSEKDLLIHELKVHQIELEMQNNALIESQRLLDISNEQYRLLFDCSPVGLVIIDFNGTVKRANKTFRTMISLEDKDNINNRPFSEFLFADDQKIFTSRLRAFFNMPDEKEMILRLTGKKSRHLHVQITGSCFESFDEPGNQELQLSLTDITERMETEKQNEALLEEKSVLLKEVHHRIKNNMVTIEALLNLQAEACDNTQTKKVLMNAVGRVVSMRVLYEKLYRSDNFSRVDSGDYLTGLLDEIVSIFYEKSVQVTKRIENFAISSRNIIPIGILINEIITNSMKYAFDSQENPEIVVEATKNDQEITILLKDNGPGLPDGFSIEKSESFGLKLVSILTRQLKGTIQYENRNGACFILKFLSD